MSSKTMPYMLFPYTILAERECRNLSLLLPRWSVLEVVRPPIAPDWLSERVTGWRTLVEPEPIETVKDYLKGYQEFATVHGENSVLASLNLGQISKDSAESRFRIRTRLKEGDSNESNEWISLLLEAAIFLEMARDLDEKEIDLQAGLAQVDKLEGEFRKILGISDEEELADTIETLSSPLRAEQSHLSFMLPKRIGSWFRLLSTRPPQASPVLVTTTEQVVEELFEPVRAEYDRAEKRFEPVRIALSSLPAMDDLATEEFSNLQNDPEASGLLKSYWQCLENIIGTPHDLTRQEELTQAAGALQTFLHQYRRKIGLPDGPPMKFDLVFDSEIKWSAIRKYCDPAGAPGQLMANPCPDGPMKILVCQF